MGHPAQINDAGFEGTVLQSKTPVLVDFWAEWCAPCKMVAPVVEELAQDYSGRLKVAKLNVDENPQTPVKYSVMSIPTLILFKKGQVLTQVVGFKPKDQFKKVLDEALGEAA